ncbi:hypothetical protein ACS0TY_006465 [Phlomoides rotata]
MGHWCLKDENEKVPVPELMEQIASVTGVLSEQQRLICHDYKLDKAWKHYAGVQEMMGLSYFMLDQPRKDA